MFQTLPENKFKWIEKTSQFNENFMKSFNEPSDEGYFLEVDVQYTKKFEELHNDLPFLLERKKTKKLERLVTNLCEKNEYGIHIRNLKKALNHGLILKQVHSVI